MHVHSCDPGTDKYARAGKMSGQDLHNTDTSHLRSALHLIPSLCLLRLAWMATRYAAKYAVRTASTATVRMCEGYMVSEQVGESSGCTFVARQKHGECEQRHGQQDKLTPAFKYHLDLAGSGVAGCGSGRQGCGRGLNGSSRALDLRHFSLAVNVNVLCTWCACFQACKYQTVYFY